MNIAVFLGAPGSGKGTQAKRLADTYGFKHFSTGDMLRAAIQASKPVGLKAKQFMDRGELVPDNVMIELIEDALQALDGKTRVLLDGFPRTVPQAQALDKNERTKVGLAIYFKMPREALIQRLTGRRICKACGESFHLIFMPPKKEGVCDKCGGPLIQRPDDSEAVVQRRLEVFEGQNSGLLDYYNGQRKLKEIDADQEVAVIQKTLLKLLN